MFGYLYILLLTLILSYSVLRDILRFKKGKYNPYAFRRGKDDLPYGVNLVIALFIFIGGAIYGKDPNILHTMTFVFIVYSACLLICVNTMNYLSYLKNNDRNIIIQTIILDILVISVTIGIWNYIIR